MGVEHADVTEDAVLGGRLVLRQPRKGHRVGHDAILLAAACSARPRERLIELGAGVGAAGLAVARRVNDLRHSTPRTIRRRTAAAGLRMSVRSRRRGFGSIPPHGFCARPAFSR